MMEDWEIEHLEKSCEIMERRHGTAFAALMRLSLKIAEKPIIETFFDAESLLRLICVYLRVEVADIKGKLRYKPYNEARCMYCHFGRKFLTHRGFPLSYAQIGVTINRDHAAVYHQCSVAKYELSVSKLRPKYKELEQLILTQMNLIENREKNDFT